MPKTPPPGPPGESQDDLGETLETGFYEAPPTQLEGAPSRRGEEVGRLLDEALGGETDPQWIPPDEPDLSSGSPGGRPRGLKIAAAVALVALVAAAALVYRSRHRSEVLAQGLARARQLVLLDTHAGYRDAAQILEPLVAVDPVQAGSMRAFALATLAADYRDEEAVAQAEALLVEPERAEVVPAAAFLARAALALQRREAGTASSFVARAGSNPFASLLEGRIAFLAGNLAAAVEPLEAALAQEPRLAAALALRGDLLRRGRNPGAARGAYTAALVASPGHPRAVFGMAKLALDGRLAPGEAVPHLESLLADRDGTPLAERARAALHLAALRGRAGDREGSRAALAAVELPAAARVWIERASAEEERQAGYRVVGGALPSLQSASDDDPYVPAPAVHKAKAKKKVAKANPRAKRSKKATVKKKSAASKKKAARKPAPRAGR